MFNLLLLLKKQDYADLHISRNTDMDLNDLKLTHVQDPRCLFVIYIVLAFEFLEYPATSFMNVYMYLYNYTV